MKINSEARLLLIMGLFVLLGGGAMVLVNRPPGAPPPTPPTPTPLTWTDQNFDPLVAKAAHTRGDAAKARYTIVEFGDFECPNCRHSYNALLTQVEKRWPIRFIFYNFPLDMHPHAMPAAVAVQAAGDQGKFWPMFDAVYSDEKTVPTPDVVEQAAQKVGLDLTKFHKDSDAVDTAKAVQADHDLAVSLNISSTPTFIVRDEKTKRTYQIVGGTELDQLMSRLNRTAPIMPPAPPAGAPAT